MGQLTEVDIYRDVNLEEVNLGDDISKKLRFLHRRDAEAQGMYSLFSPLSS